jgi:mono/diheme cytochrome c family protein
MHCRSLFLSLALCALSVAGQPPAGLEAQFKQTVRPFIDKHCAGCHSGKTPAAQLNLQAYDSLAAVSRDYPHWATVMERLTLKDMPPKPLPAPPAADSQRVIAWIQKVRAEEIRKHAGDPGLVPARRLSNAEYNYTIRDLTGQDLQVTREFPVDPANPAGFDNSGESLTMSPALLNKYLQAAREVANHMVLTPDTVAFASHPMLVETDREKYAIQRIMTFYGRQPVKLAAYFQAAWRYKNRKTPATTLAAAAAEAKVSPKYLPLVWQILQEPNAVGPIRKLQQMFAAAPAPDFPVMENFVVRIRANTGMQYAAPKVAGLPPGSQPLLNWKLREFAIHRRESDPAALRNDTDPPPVVPAIPRYAGLHQEAAPRWAALVAKARAADMDLVVPAAERKRYEAAFARFASVFPDKFLVTERGRYFPDDSQDKGRLLSAGYHSVVGFFRDDQPLVELILDDKAKAELDRLWNEFDYIAQATHRTWVQYFFNQSGEVQGKGAESASDRPANHEVTDSEVILAMRDAYLRKAAADPSNDPIAPHAIRDHYDRINATLRGLEKQRKAAEPKHLEALVRFAGNAWRRPLTPAERLAVSSHYTTLRTKNELSHEDAIRESLVSILMAPDFLYRLDLQSRKGGNGTVALGGVALANRLSYFLWASMPDDELLRHAAAGDLQRPGVLLAQARRMMKDPRVRGFATEFTGNWLTFRNFEKNNSVDRQRFPEFNDDLRTAMFQEPIRLLEDALANNRPVLDLLYGDYTFVNPVLAKHYGMPVGEAKDWTRVDGAAQFGRGGLLPMAVFLTQNSPGLRTSPVKRGNWVVQRVLGERVPPPPPVVPELPDDEATSELPVREMLAKHRENAMCAACHQRIDSFGVAFEGYGPVGNARKTDLAGRPVDTVATYPGGTTGTGVEGLRAFIRQNREKEFVANLSRKLLAFALNRSLQLSDEALIESMQVRAAAGGYRFQTLVESILSSPQFLKKRVGN